MSEAIDFSTGFSSKAARNDGRPGVIDGAVDGILSILDANGACGVNP